MKLGEIEGIKARLDKRLGSDDLLKVWDIQHSYLLTGLSPFTLQEARYRTGSQKEYQKLSWIQFH
jgi:hypothetical protein